MTAPAVEYEQLLAAAAPHCSPTPVEVIDESDDETRSTYGVVAVTGDAWLRERAQPYLGGLRHLPGKHDQSSHGRGGGVRPALKKAKTIEDINAAGAAEAKRITGRDVHVDLAGSDPKIAREHLEGVLRGMERYPKAPVSRVVSYGPDSAIGDIPGNDGAMAFCSRGGALKNPQPTDMIAFNNAFARNPREYYEFGAASQRGKFTVRGGPLANGVHEFGHSVAGPTVANSESRARDVAARTKPAKKTLKEHVEKQLSVHAAADQRELAAEAFSDVMWNGARASRTSRDIMDMIDADYREAT